VFQRADGLGRIIQLLDQQAGALQRHGNGLGRIGRQRDPARQQIGQRGPVGLRGGDGRECFQGFAIAGHNLEQILPGLLGARGLLEGVSGQASQSPQKLRPGRRIGGQSGDLHVQRARQILVPSCLFVAREQRLQRLLVPGHVLENILPVGMARSKSSTWFCRRSATRRTSPSFSSALVE